MPDKQESVGAAKHSVAPWCHDLPIDKKDEDWPEAVVVLSLHPERGRDAAIVVRPSRAYLRRNRRVLFLVLNADPGDQITIKFKLDNDCPTDPPRAGDHPLIVDLVAGARGPFPDLGGGYVPTYKGLYHRQGPGGVLTEPATRRGFFSFDVKWVTPDETYGEDPAVIVFDHAGVSL